MAGIRTEQNGGNRALSAGMRPAGTASVAVERAKLAPVRKLRNYYDLNLLCSVVLMFLIGLIIIYSASQFQARNYKSGPTYYVMKQLKAGGIGLLLALPLSFFDYGIFKKKAFMILSYVSSIALLVLTLVMGSEIGGKTRWLQVFGNSFQPTEAAKVCLIVFFAAFIADRGTAFNRRYNWLRYIAWGIVPALLIGKENISSGIIVIMIGGTMLFVALEYYKLFIAMIAAGIGAVLGLKPLIHHIIVTQGIISRPEQYWLRRIYGWAAPEIFETDAYQTKQALYAIGSGGMIGRGLGNSIQKYGALPEAQNDMIFSVVCEEFGFLGAALVILTYLYILYRIYQIAVNARDLFGSMICTGVMAHIGLQVILNIAVVTGVIPNTGVTLPFLSAGGSAVMFTIIEIGLVLSVSHRIKV